MPEINIPPCPLHGDRPRALHTENFEGIVTVIDELLLTVSGVVGTTTYTRCPYGYPYNFEGVVRALEDLNASMSGIQGGGGGAASGIVSGSGIYITQSGDFQVINATITSASGLTITAGSGIYLSDAGTRINLNAIGDGSVTVLYSGTVAVISGTDTQGGGGGGASVTVSGEPGTGYAAGDLWFDTNQGRLFVYASGNGVSEPSWYQTNTEAIALKSETAPSGTGENAPPRDGSIWFNTLLGSLFIYDVSTSGWYEAGPSRSFAYGPSAPAATSTEGAGWFDTGSSTLKVWDGTSWTSV
jgi:hypothetical protein